MSNFTFMDFTGGHTDEFVVHAGKFTKQEAIELCLKENDYRFEEYDPPRTLTLEDVADAFVKYYVKRPEGCGFETDGGCYTYCNQGARGSFPVYVIEL